MAPGLNKNKENTFMSVDDKQVRMRLELMDSGNGTKIVPQTDGMAVSRTCTIVIIAGE